MKRASTSVRWLTIIAIVLAATSCTEESDMPATPATFTRTFDFCGTTVELGEAIPNDAVTVDNDGATIGLSLDWINLSVKNGPRTRAPIYARLYCVPPEGLGKLRIGGALGKQIGAPRVISAAGLRETEVGYEADRSVPRYIYESIDGYTFPDGDVFKFHARKISRSMNYHVRYALGEKVAVRYTYVANSDAGDMAGFDNSDQFRRWRELDVFIRKQIHTRDSMNSSQKSVDGSKPFASSAGKGDTVEVSRLQDDDRLSPRRIARGR